MIAPNPTKKKPCGCKSPCNCHSQCPQPNGSGSLVRPEFFAGQLLTEQDLSSLVRYTVAKNQLHNRHLFGDGVVCGLDVTVDPCASGQVHVDSGYALDCCGNDIVVDCPETVDVLALQRDLYASRGLACVDPCRDDGDDREDRDDWPGKLDKKPAAAVNKERRTFCLYIRYCETPEEHTTPYDLDDGCGRANCMPSRIREGYRFELDCEPSPPTHDLLDCILESLGNLEQTNKQLTGFGNAIECLHKLPHPDDVLRAVKTDVELDAEILHRGHQLLHEFNETVEKDGLAKIDEERLRGSLNRCQELGSAYARFCIGPPESPDQRGRFSELIEGNREHVESYLRSIKRAPAFKRLSGFERETADFVVDQTSRFHRLAIQMISAPEEMNVEFSEDDRIFAQGFAAKPERCRHLPDQFQEFRAWLLRRIERSGLHSDLTLRDDLLAIKIPRRSETDQRALMLSIASRLMGLLIRYLIDVICSCLNPSCTSCDDNRVLLACLTIEDCKVVRVCNLHRKIVPSPAALRYWAFPVRLVTRWIERICCHLPSELQAVGQMVAAQKDFKQSSGWFKPHSDVAFDSDWTMGLASTVGAVSPSVDEDQLASTFSAASRLFSMHPDFDLSDARPWLSRIAKTAMQFQPPAGDADSPGFLKTLLARTGERPKAKVAKYVPRPTHRVWFTKPDGNRIASTVIEVDRDNKTCLVEDGDHEYPQVPFANLEFIPNKGQTVWYTSPEDGRKRKHRVVDFDDALETCKLKVVNDDGQRADIDVNYKDIQLADE